MVDEVPLPDFNVLKRIQQATRLSEWLSSFPTDRDLTQHDTDQLASMAGTLIKKYHIQLKQTLLQLVGRRPSRNQLKRLAWQLVGRQEELERRPLPIVDAPTANGWVAVKIDSITDIAWADDKAGYKLSLSALSGSPAGFKLSRSVPARWLTFIAYKIGYSRRMEYQDEPQHLIGLLLWAYVVSKPDGLDMVSWNMDKHMSKHNKEILKLRNRFFLDNGPECPFELDTDCIDCTRLTHECQASIRDTEHANHV